MRWKSVIPVILVLLACSTLATAQTEEEPQTTIRERLEVTEVLLDVVVTDSVGNIIIGHDRRLEARPGQTPEQPH